MDDDKRILIFSDAGGTGRSYHADLGARNQRLRIHYLLEAGWQADNAIQGLGRIQPHQPGAAAACSGRWPTNVKGEKRFLSTIARRLDTLGAITRGQRQTGGAGPVPRRGQSRKPLCARGAAAVLHAAPPGQDRRLLAHDLRGRSPGLSLTTDEGGLRDELPPITTWLNRLLALRIETQNRCSKCSSSC